MLWSHNSVTNEYLSNSQVIMILRTLLLLATIRAAAGADLLEISAIDGSPENEADHPKEKAIDRNNATYYHSAYGKSVVFIHISLTEAAMVKRVVISDK